jgi:hypothetical protein
VRERPSETLGLVHVARFRELLAKLRFLSEADLCVMANTLGRDVSINDFVGALRVSDLRPSAVRRVRALGAVSTLLGAKYLRELLPPTGLDGLLVIVERMSEDLRAIWNHCERLRICEILLIEIALGRPLQLDDLAHTDSFATLTPDTLAMIRKLAVGGEMPARLYASEIVRGPDGASAIHFVGYVVDGREHEWMSGGAPRSNSQAN